MRIVTQLVASAPLASVALGQLTGNATASPSSNTSTAAPIATIYPDTSNGKPIEVLGRSTGGLDYYLGIPYGVPPVADLRWTRPTSLTYNTSTVNASSFAPACIQPTDVGGFGNIAGSYGTSEDCLYLNVITPEGGHSNSWAPVIVFIPGGGYQGGSPSTYDGSSLVLRSVQTLEPVIYVSISYRVGILGFPVGKDFVDEGAANLGLRDVVLALEWVKANIWAFGGDPDRVTVSGQSAGAGLTSLLYLNRDTTLFRSGIVMSGSPTLGNFAPGTTALSSNATGSFVGLTGCGTSSTLACLKGISADRLLDAQTNVSSLYGSTQLFGPITDNDLIPANPYALLPQGSFARHPLLIGNTLDEGTLFTDSRIASEEQFRTTVTGGNNSTEKQQFADRILELYPADPSQGSPFGTGNETFGLSPTFKRAAAFVGDNIFQAGRRQFARAFAMTGAPIWAFETLQPPPSGLPLPGYAGVFHGTDVGYLLALFPTFGVNYTEPEKLFTATLQSYWLNFINNGDPNVGNTPNLTEWPQYGAEHTLLALRADNYTALPDTYREEAMSLLTTDASTGVE